MYQNDKIEALDIEASIRKRYDESEPKGYQIQAAHTELDADYIRMIREGINLLKRIIEGRNEMHDYMTSSLAFGGYNYRKVCEVFKINTITIKFYKDDKICIKSPQKIIVFENQELQMYELIV